jgi:hypothetical protein
MNRAPTTHLELLNISTADQAIFYYRCSGARSAISPLKVGLTLVLGLQLLSEVSIGEEDQRCDPHSLQKGGEPRIEEAIGGRFAIPTA